METILEVVLPVAESQFMEASFTVLWDVACVLPAVPVTVVV